MATESSEGYITALQMILCQQSSFIISAVLVSTLKYIFHSKF